MRKKNRATSGNGLLPFIFHPEDDYGALVQSSNATEGSERRSFI
jgi:hypothetical protein